MSDYCKICDGVPMKMKKTYAESTEQIFNAYDGMICRACLKRVVKKVQYEARRRTDSVMREAQDFDVEPPKIYFIEKYNEECRVVCGHLSMDEFSIVKDFGEEYIFYSEDDLLKKLSEFGIHSDRIDDTVNEAESIAVSDFFYEAYTRMNDIVVSPKYRSTLVTVSWDAHDKAMKELCSDIKNDESNVVFKEEILNNILKSYMNEIKHSYIDFVSLKRALQLRSTRLSNLPYKTSETKYEESVIDELVAVLASHHISYQ